MTLKTWGSGWPEAGRGVEDRWRQQDTEDKYQGQAFVPTQPRGDSLIFQEKHHTGSKSQNSQASGHKVFLESFSPSECDAQWTPQDWWKGGMVSDGDMQWPVSQSGNNMWLRFPSPTTARPPPTPAAKYPGLSLSHHGSYLTLIKLC